MDCVELAVGYLHEFMCLQGVRHMYANLVSKITICQRDLGDTDIVQKRSCDYHQVGSVRSCL